MNALPQIDDLLLGDLLAADANSLREPDEMGRRVEPHPMSGA